jgi:hypothetical protein
LLLTGQKIALREAAATGVKLSRLRSLEYNAEFGLLESASGRSPESSLTPDS